MATNHYSIRRITRTELDTVFQWSALEGWNPGLQDGDGFYAADPDGYFGGFYGQEFVASVSAVAYSQNYGFIGLYIVRPEFRGRRFGLALFNAALDYLGSRTIGLDGVVERQADYARMGFKAVYRNIRFRHVPADKHPQALGIKDLTTIPFEHLLEYDKALFPAPRPDFLKHWLSQPGTVALAKMDAGRLAGYGVIRAAYDGYRIGPLFADTADSASQLFLGLCAQVESGKPVFWDAPDINPAAMDLAKRHGMAMVFESARMYKGAAPVLPMERIFAMTTLELG
jgi:GNAT superfamily N-acetyltransferase